MADPRYSEDEQAERLKEWWKKNGTSVIVGAALGVGIIVGVNLWRDHVKDQAETASQRFSELLALQGDRAIETGEALKAEYSDTPYAALSALYMAKIRHDQGDIAGAEAMLKWALENAVQASTRHVARLRLARIYLQQERVPEAEALAGVTTFDGFESQYHELVGDIAMHRNDASSARAAYEKAISSMPSGSGYSELLVLKLDHATGEAAQ